MKVTIHFSGNQNPLSPPFAEEESLRLIEDFQAFMSAAREPGVEPPGGGSYSYRFAYAEGNARFIVLNFLQIAYIEVEPNPPAH